MKDISETLYAMTEPRRHKPIPYWMVGKHRHEWHTSPSRIDFNGNHIAAEDWCSICLAIRPHKY